MHLCVTPAAYCQTQNAEAVVSQDHNSSIIDSIYLFCAGGSKQFEDEALMSLCDVGRPGNENNVKRFEDFSQSERQKTSERSHCRHTKEGYIGRYSQT